MTLSNTPLKTPLIIKNVVLKVHDLNNMTRFYNEMIGLQVMCQSETESQLGAVDSDQAILTLKKIEGSFALVAKTGLYHTAFLLPTRKDLANTILWLSKHQVMLEGASDHGYSEALYLKDPEGNDIEIYVDKEISEWDIEENGNINGVTEPMIINDVLATADGKWLGMAPGTTMGHIHLFVSDLDKTETFYRELLGLDLKMDFGSQAKFFAAGLYHHQIGTNIWKGRNIPALDELEYGLDYYTLQVADQADYEDAKQRLLQAGYEIQASTNEFKVTDPNGIKVKVTY